MAANAKKPEVFVTVRRVAREASWASATSAPGTTPPWASATVPLSSPVMRWARAPAGHDSRIADARTASPLASWSFATRVIRHLRERRTLITSRCR